VTWYSPAEAAERAGVEPSYVARLIDLGILAPEEPDRCSGGDVRGETRWPEASEAPEDANGLGVS
jgi:hypothetical protein